MDTFDLEINNLEKINDIKPFLDKLKQYYPNTDIWFDKVKRELLEHSDIRTLVTVSKYGKVIGMMILKRDEVEKKICSIMVDPEYRNQELGKLLIRSAFDILGTTTPLITVNAVIWATTTIKYLLKGFGFVYSRTIKNLYKDGEDELLFNE